MAEADEQIEPNTNGKVIIQTTAGDLQVELWGKQAPIASRNFIQLALEGFYDGTNFHRLVPKYVLQGGINENLPFPPEFSLEYNPRIKFTRRGMLAMTNMAPQGVRHCTQFFFALGPAPDLDKQATIFGKVTGDCIYNLVRIGDTDPAEDVQKIIIKSIKIVVNPFDDIIPRNFTQQDINLVRKSAKLSFTPVSSVTEPTVVEKANTNTAAKGITLDETKKKELQQLESQIERMKREIRNPTSQITKSDATLEKEDLSLVEQQRKKYFKRKPPLDEMHTLLELNRFREKLSGNQTEEGSQTSQTILMICKLHGLVECKSCQNLQPHDSSIEDKDDVSVGWMTHKLHFADSEYSRTLREQQRQDLQDLLVIDPKKRLLNPKI